MFCINKDLSNSIQYLKGVGPHLAKLLARKGVMTLCDALYFVPRTYEDRRTIRKIIDLVPGEKQITTGEILILEERMTRVARKKLFTVTITDGTGHLNLKWFKGVSYLKNRFKRGQKLVVSGIVTLYAGELEIHHPDLEILEPEKPTQHAVQGSDYPNIRRVVPVYSETEGLTQKTIRKIIKRVIDEKLILLDDFIPPEILTEHHMLDLKLAIKEIHLPDQNSDFKRLENFSSRAHLRLVFNEFFVLQLIMEMRRKQVKETTGIAFKGSFSLSKQATSNLPFKLTTAQKLVCEEIEKDLREPRPMNRLIQGDVGSGKTLVAILSALKVIEAGYQVLFMVPTEILATQHYKSAHTILEPLGVRSTLLISGLRISEKKLALSEIENGTANLIIGTHALIQKNVTFKNPGLAIIDEQHRFGVKQRQTLTEKGKVNIDILIMTATPIPRTLALTVYGDLDISTINEMPPGRTPVKTKIFYERTRENLYTLIREHVEKKEQVYIVYPLVEESEQLDLKDATNMHEKLKNEIFPDFNLDFIHGKLKHCDKKRIMGDFEEGSIDILISTTVIEVGVDIQQATLMVVEHAERFGLSQLHQLRGRVGRGERPSICALMTNFKRSEISDKRLEVMVETNNGFLIAEEDLAIRGPGEFLGTRQSGLPGFRIGNIMRDQKILTFAREKASALLKKDPNLDHPEHRALRQVIECEKMKIFYS